jgi:Anti-sigma-K factor rskA/Putative zinc-finger
MSEHEQFGEDLALYALHALSGDERAELEKHLATCASCRLELERLRGDGALLALATLGPKPPQRARQRLLDALAKEAASSAALPRKTGNHGAPGGGALRHSWWGWLGWAATAAVLVFGASLWRENVQLKTALSMAHVSIGERTADLERANKIANVLTNPSGQHFTLVATKTAPQPQGRAIYVREHGSLVFMASNLPAVPAHKAYELWLIPTQGAPIPAGVFQPDAHGSATLLNPPLPAGTEAKAFAITVENEAGSATPTMPIVMMGAGE